jgi:hypothetical protein
LLDTVHDVFDLILNALLPLSAENSMLFMSSEISGLAGV